MSFGSLINGVVKEAIRNSAPSSPVNPGMFNGPASTNTPSTSTQGNLRGLMGQAMGGVINGNMGNHANMNSISSLWGNFLKQHNQPNGISSLGNLMNNSQINKPNQFGIDMSYQMSPGITPGMPMQDKFLGGL